MKKIYEIPKINIITFRSEDIITTSLATNTELTLNEVSAINGSGINWN
ncbi:MAG: hypothetical protein IJ583_04815 [Firmicutes bacterium]|nr:hypothetical protein [Bacillota bacterium]